ncbi:MAG: hypothetical protein C4B59_06570 [Candidatus Methanogaster sp.]|uniref:Uncharacterized protein n=1 Tax=Candidatus Methanogaster sp. TaxID=3386292 RepID=A0AC61L407_9EURY|nr:MAG: hypothetical protein C4B59_06570 [ANME-2 cluster archaeon]
MNRNKYILLVAIVLLSSMSMACVTEDDAAPDKGGSANVVTPGDSESKESQTEPAVEIILFHGTRRCTSCIVTGQLLNEVLHTYYSGEVENGTITFREVNAETDRKTAAEYGVRYVSVYINHEIYPDALANYADPDRFAEEMRKKIDEALLNGS